MLTKAGSGVDAVHQEISTIGVPKTRRTMSARLNHLPEGTFVNLPGEATEDSNCQKWRAKSANAPFRIGAGNAAKGQEIGRADYPDLRCFCLGRSRLHVDDFDARPGHIDADRFGIIDRLEIAGL